MKKQSNLIFQNLSALRQYHKYSQEEVAEKVGVSRQAVAKWESGETVPDILNCDALAELYDVSLDSLIHYDQEKEHMPIPPKGKHLFGTVKVGDRGQIVLPKKARDLFRIKQGDLLVVLGDENPETAGIALVPGDTILRNIASLRDMLNDEKEEIE
ncbi:helix-turn-helix domain-containing protein [Merdimonas faecis]|uniref:helix-turn-helix domain-containing protein n=1 Tax=Merdimonas faecis TaxID=1653435 RepID=UPI003209909B